MSTNQWDERYATDEYVYGTEPNDFLREQCARIPKGGRVLCLADGEGRNGVFLAEQGYDVTSVDGSEVGLVKACQLALERGVQITTIHADLAEFDMGSNAWDGIVSVFCHLPSPLRKRIHAAVASALAPGGVFILEAYRPDQVELATGGPKDVDFLMTEELLTHELVGCNVVLCREIEREIHEGTLHNGVSSVVQFVAQRKA